MKTKRSSTVLIFLILMVPSASAWSDDRETVQLESQLEALQDQTTRMQQAFDERVGSMYSLNKKNADAINKLLTTITRTSVFSRSGTDRFFESQGPDIGPDSRAQ